MALGFLFGWGADKRRVGTMEIETRVRAGRDPESLSPEDLESYWEVRIDATGQKIEADTREAAKAILRGAGARSISNPL